MFFTRSQITLAQSNDCHLPTTEQEASRRLPPSRIVLISILDASLVCSKSQEAIHVGLSLYSPQAVNHCRSGDDDFTQASTPQSTPDQ
jgi:hypothetical protein